MKRIIVCILLCATLASVGYSSIACSISNPKPDLIIEDVTYEFKTQETDLSDVIVYGEFTIQIKNIGDAPANGYIYVSFDGGTGAIKKDANTPIKPNETFIGKIQTGPLSSNETARLIVNDPNMLQSDTLPDLGDGYPQNVKAPRLVIDESDYDNNTYTFTLNE